MTAPVFGSAANGLTGFQTTTFSLSGVITGGSTADRFLGVLLSPDRAGTLSSVTADGVAMTQGDSWTNISGFQVYFWYIAGDGNVGTGAITIAGNTSATLKIAYKAFIYTGVDGTSPISAIAHLSAYNASPYSQTIASATGDTVAQVVDFRGGNHATVSITAGSGCTIQSNTDDATNDRTLVIDIAGGASVAVGASANQAGDWESAAFSLKAASAAAYVAKKNILVMQSVNRGASY